ncbi:MAG: hypothetical protein ABIE07_12675 [Candidatus Zixiibacteriota bacterium]
MNKHPIFAVLAIAIALIFAGSVLAGFSPLSQNSTVEYGESSNPECCPEGAICIPIEECTPEMMENCIIIQCSPGGPGCCGK